MIISQKFCESLYYVKTFVHHFFMFISTTSRAEASSFGHANSFPTSIGILKLIMLCFFSSFAIYF